MPPCPWQTLVGLVIDPALSGDTYPAVITFTVCGLPDTPGAVTVTIAVL